MTRLLEARLVTDALLAVLNQSPVLIGDGEVPDGAGFPGDDPTVQFVPYAVLHPMSGGVIGGPIDGPEEDAWVLYQVTGVGSTREQSEWVADQTRDVLLSLPASVNGRDVLAVMTDMLGGSRRDDSLSPAQPTVWMTVDRYRVVTTPA